MTDHAPSPTEIRLRLRAAGFSPVPLNGKSPDEVVGWQRLGDATEHEIRRWASTRSAHLNTGVLTRLAPGFDVDILDEDCAVAVERMLRERFEDDNRFIVRFGRVPKRLVLFRTDEPFDKILVKLIAPDGATGQRIELLCDGQQAVVHGVHPDTGKPYDWFGGEPGEVKRGDLPPLVAAKAREIAAAAVEIAEKHGYRREQTKPATRKAKPNGSGSRANWAVDYSDHDQLAAHAMRLLRTGMNDGAAVNSLRGGVEALTNIDPDRKVRRLREIPNMVSSAREKLDAEKKPESQLKPPPTCAPQNAPAALEATLKVFEEWLILPSRTPVYAMLGAVAANLLLGDPVWLGLVAPPSSAKTEILNSTSKLPFVTPAATLTAAGLLSGTPRKDRDKTAKGGLLRHIGAFGVLALKDFGSVLSMYAEGRAELLAALREIYDGAWTRHVGADGGRTLHWEGKLGLVFAVTTAIDSYHAVIGSLGDRFLLCRMEPVEKGQFKWALKHDGAQTGQMRKELAEAVAQLFAGRKTEAQQLSELEADRIDQVISLVVRLRGAVERDRHRRELEMILGAEGPARIGLCLARLLAGLDTLGLDRAAALDVIESVAKDSVPPLRRRAFEYIEAGGDEVETSEVAAALGLPTNTVRRVLEDLAAYHLIDRKRAKKGYADKWRKPALCAGGATSVTGTVPANYYYEQKRRLRESSNTHNPRLRVHPSESPSRPANPGDSSARTTAPGRRHSAQPPEEIVAAARGSGIRFDQADDGGGFVLDERQASADAVIIRILREAIYDNYEAILALLKREAGS
jgi:bifunctional DNA primase/polymerase-like protein